MLTRLGTSKTDSKKREVEQIVKKKEPSEQIAPEVFFNKAEWQNRFMTMEIILIPLVIVTILLLLVTNAVGISHLSNTVLITLIGVFVPTFLLVKYFL